MPEGVGRHWGCISVDRPTRFVAAWALAASEDEAAPQVVAQTRRCTWGQCGWPWVSDGWAVYRQELRCIYRDLQRTGKRISLPLMAASSSGPA